MAEPFLAEIRLCSFNFAPRGWALCNGQFLPINQNQALFSLLGTTYGGNGQTTFALPDLRGRRAIMQGGGHTLGEKAGTESHSLSLNEIPMHQHGVTVSTAAGHSNSPVNAYPASSSLDMGYAASAGAITGAGGSVGNAGSSQPHQNLSPFLVLNYIIALQGIFPSPN
jgi:microcystin-dependent protein